ncbi:MAG: SDR family NAD(P)-dependent oxidoreductase [Proteobacteria bacterium]|nr:SDR family NAD(P)-dependent oxidoreductase [Pseudomonadota bacterium]
MKVPGKRKSTPRQSKAAKVAVVTGGGSGLGRDIANRLAGDGYQVAILGRRADRLVPKRGERALHPYVCDVADRKQVRDTVKAIRHDLKRIDLLVNNAGILRRATHDEITPELIDEQLGTNLIGMMRMCLVCIPALKKTGGNIVNISSTLSDRCSPQFGVYAASKGAMNAWSKTLAMELARWGIRVNVVSPSLVSTEIFLADGMTPAEFEDRYQTAAATRFPIGRGGRPEDVSGLVSYLASNDAGWLTGQVIMLDGGESVGRKSW